MNNITLPDLVFFDPTPDAVKQIVKIAGNKLVVDCGCGTGHLVGIMHKNGVQAIGIDLYERENSLKVNMFYHDASVFQFKKQHLAIIARPNRGEWIRKTIRLANENGADILYIGIEDHLEEDIEGLNFVKIMDSCGREDESMWLLKAYKEKTMNKYFLVQWFIHGNGSCPPVKLGPSWFEDGGNEWTSDCGSFMLKREDDVIVSSVEAESFEELDYSLTSLNQPDSKAGWLDRNGKFYGCDSTKHDLYAYCILHQSVAQLECEGWVRIY